MGTFVPLAPWTRSPVPSAEVGPAASATANATAGCMKNPPSSSQAVTVWGGTGMGALPGAAPAGGRAWSAWAAAPLALLSSPYTTAESRSWAAAGPSHLPTHSVARRVPLREGWKAAQRQPSVAPGSCQLVSPTAPRPPPPLRPSSRPQRQDPRHRPVVWALRPCTWSPWLSTRGSP